MLVHALVVASLVKTSLYGHLTAAAALQSFISPGFPERSLFSTVLVFVRSKLQPQRKKFCIKIVTISDFTQNKLARKKKIIQVINTMSK